MSQETLEKHKSYELNQLFEVYGGKLLIITNRRYYYDEPVGIQIVEKSSDGKFYKIYENPDESLVRVNRVRWVQNNVPFKLLSDNV